MLLAFRERGPLLYRLRHRLELEDDAWLLSDAESEFARIAARLTTSDSVRSDWIVALATWHGAIHEGRRVLASEAFVRLLWIQEKFPIPDDLRKLRTLAPQAVRRGWADDVCPWFFDSASAVAAIERLPREILSDMPQSSVYFAGWARSARDESLTRDGIARMREHQLGRDWIWLMDWELRLRRDPESLDRFRTEWTQRQDDRNRGDLTGSYVRYVGQLIRLDAVSDPRDVDRQILDCLWVVANAVELDAEIPAAALFRAIQWTDRAGRDRESRILRQALLEQYSRTYHARLLASRLENPDQTSDDSRSGPFEPGDEPGATGVER